MYTVYLFLVCVVYAIYKRLYEYATAWLLLFISSYLAHNIVTNNIKYSKFIYIFDRIMISIVVFVGFYYYIKSKIKSPIPPICFILTVIMYYTKLLTHEYVHIFSVIGHLAIMYYYIL